MIAFGRTLNCRASLPKQEQPIHWRVQSYHAVDTNAPTFDDSLNQDESLQLLMKLYARRAGLRDALANDHDYGEIRDRQAAQDEVDRLTATLNELRGTYSQA